jgi:SAM-dependent methyltransferase
MAAVAAGNRDMAAAWDGEDGAHWAVHADRYDRGTAPYRERLLSAAALVVGERTLDVGCGAGRTTREAARAVAPSGHALGVDLSALMLEHARSASAADGVDNVTFEQADAQVHEFATSSYDVAMSQFGIMFFSDPVAALANIRSALTEDGRALFLVWQALSRNEWASTLRGTLAAGRELPTPPPGAPGPFSWADPETAQRLLTSAGFTDVALEDVPGDFNIGPDPDDALEFVRGMGVARSLLADLDDATVERALADLRAAFAEHRTDRGVVFRSAAWLVTARAG